MQVSLSYPLFIPFEYIPRNRIAGSLDRSIFNFLRSSHTVFHIGYTNLYSHQLSTSLPSCISSLLDNCHSDSCKTTCHFGFICISLMISCIEHLFLYLLAICMSSLNRCLFRSSAYFLTVHFCFCYYYVSSLYTLGIISLSDILFSNLLAHSISCLFIIFTCFFCCAEAFYFDVVLLAFVAGAFAVVFFFFLSHCQDQYQDLFLCFLLKVLQFQVLFFSL